MSSHFSSFIITCVIILNMEDCFRDLVMGKVS